MIPLVGTVQELANQAAIVRSVAEQRMKKQGVTLKYLVGTMIEVPRAAVVAENIAREAEFFSFGTNDLTQMAFGFARTTRASPARICERKSSRTIRSVSIDREGAGALMDLAVKGGRKHAASSSWGSAVNTAAIRHRWSSVIASGWTTCPARRSASPSRSCGGAGGAREGRGERSPVELFLKAIIRPGPKQTRGAMVGWITGAPPGLRPAPASSA
jgi:hypothetical protein